MSSSDEQDNRDYSDEDEDKYEEETSLISTDTHDGCALFVIDSGASSHMSYDISDFKGVRPTKKKIHTANGGVMHAQGVGSAQARIKVNGRDIALTLNNCLYVPTLKEKLVSLSKLDDHGFTTVFKNGRVSIVNPDGRLAATGTRTGALFRMDLDSNFQREA